jgi:hypothetical protein
MIRHWSLSMIRQCGAIRPFLWCSFDDICPKGYICIEWNEFDRSYFFNRETRHVIVKNFSECPGHNLPSSLWEIVDSYYV